MHVFIESAQRTPNRQAVSATPSLNAVLIIRVIIDFTVLCIVLHTVHRNFQKCNFWWTHSACLGPSIAAISHTISAHKVLHQRVRLWQRNVYLRFNHSYWIFAHGWFSVSSDANPTAATKCGRISDLSRMNKATQMGWLGWCVFRG